MLKRSDIVGHAIRHLHQDASSDFEGIDQAWTYFTLDTGIAFALPYSHLPDLTRAEVPRTAKPFSRQDSKSIVGARIVELFRLLDDESEPDESPAVLQLDNRLYVTERQVAPEGLCVGLIVLTRDKWEAMAADGWRWVPFFTNDPSRSTPHE
jgi:hypothetical protein